MSAEGERGPRGRGLLMALSGVAVLTMLASGVFGARGVRKHDLLEEQLGDLRARREAVVRDNARLAAEARALRESPIYVEWVVRQELGWIRPGEKVLRLDE